MRTVFLIAVVTWLATIPRSRAASIEVRPEHSSQGIYSIYLDGGQYNGASDTMSVRITPLAHHAFVNIDPDGWDSRPRQIGEPYTYINALLEGMGFGWDPFVVLGKVTSPTLVPFDATRLGQKLDTTYGLQPGLFLANVMQTGPSRAEVDIIRSGVILETLSRRIPIPEPAGFLLALVALRTLALGRRRAGIMRPGAGQRNCKG